MEAKGTQKRWTYSEFARLPESGSTRYEIIDDELVVTPSPSSKHQKIVGKVVYRLIDFAMKYDLGDVFPGPADILFAEGDYFEPDIVFVRRDHLHLVSDRGIEGPPDLVVEVLSPSTADRDRGIKLERYRLYGVPEYWVVDPEARSVALSDLTSGSSELTIHRVGDVLRWTPLGGGPTLELAVEGLFDLPAR